MIRRSHLAFIATALPFCLLTAPLHADTATQEPIAIQPKLIPQPLNMRQAEGGFTVTASTRVLAGDGEKVRRVGAQFKAMLPSTLPLALDLSKAGRAAGTITFSLDSAAKWPNADAYRLDIDRGGVRVQAGTEKGLYYGAVTLAQLLTSGDVGATNVRLPALQIDDAPRFGWRGFMLDSARHFQSVDEIKRLLDAMAQLKLDVFHWHLTDDQGWRFPVPGWPKLIEVGSCRIPAGDGGVDADTGKPVPYCGFYTEAQIRDVVAYAAARHIEIVPEVDVPGHATAAIAAYPQLGVSGQPIAVSPEWGVNVNLFNADESTMRFLEDVFGQVVKLFPGRYVHVGGDEAVKDQWKASPKMQSRIRELGVNGEEGLQAWMLARLEKYLSAHGKRLLGWDEILAGQLPPAATVMSWRGIEGGIDAAKQGHDVVMAPSDTLYFDYLQTASADEIPGRPTMIPLQRVYDFEPVPKVLDAQQAKHILGVQANVWTEHMRSFARVQHAFFPRIAAVAETAWSPQSARSYTSFLQRLPAMLPRWQQQGIAYAQTPFQPQFDAQLGNAGAVVTLREPLGYTVRYTTDGSAPTAHSPLYYAPLAVTLPVNVQAQAYFNEIPLAAPVQKQLTAASLLTRRSDALGQCPDGGRLVLRLEDDGPREGVRELFNVDIFNPCWQWTQAPLNHTASIEVRAGRLPYFFQLAHDEPNRKFKPAKTAHGELELHAGCDGPMLASLPLPAQPDADGFITLRAPITATAAKADLCIWFTGDTRPTIWAVDRVTLIPNTEKTP